MKKIIGLYGRANCGKSSTLKKLIQIFEECPNAHKEEKFEEFNGDFRITFTFKDKCVCVATGGDDKSIIEENCNYFKNNKFDIAISATRAAGGTCDSLNDFATEHNGKMIWHKKYIESFDYKKYQDEINELEAKELFEYIDELCK